MEPPFLDRVDPFTYSYRIMVMSSDERSCVVTEQDVLDKISESESISLGEKGLVKLWREDEGFGLFLLRHWTDRRGFIGRTRCDHYEILIACVDSLGDEPAAVDTLLNFLNDFKPYEQLEPVKRARFMEWSLNNIQEKVDECSEIASKWTNKAHAIYLVGRPVHMPLHGRWSSQIVDGLRQNPFCDVEIGDNQFVIKFAWQAEQQPVQV